MSNYLNSSLPSLAEQALLRNYYLKSIGLTRWVLRPAPQISLQTTVVASTQPLNATQPLSSITTPNLVNWYQQQDQAHIIFLADPIHDNQRNLLHAIIQACAKNNTYSAGQLCAEIANAQDFLDAFPLSCTHILLFGTAQAKLMDATFTQPGIYHLGAIKVCVTYSLAELATQPECKRELWTAWKSII